MLRFGIAVLVACSSPPQPTSQTVTPTPVASTQPPSDAPVPIDASIDAAELDAYEACRQNDQASCDALAAACDSGVSVSCVKLGNVHRLATKIDDVKARAWFARACKLPKGPFDGCVGVAEIDCRVGDSKAKAGAVGTLRRACEDGNSGPSCSYVGLMYAEGLCDVPYNAGSWSLGVRWYQRACDLGHLGGCTHLGLLVRSGHGVTKDERRGKQILDDACKRGDTVACEYAKSND